MHLKLALKTLVSAALLFGATAAFAEDPMDTPLPGDVQMAQPVKSHTAARHRAAPAAAVSNSTTSDAQAPGKAHAKSRVSARSHKHVTTGSRHATRHGKTTKSSAHASRHGSKKAVHSSKPRQAVRHAGKKTDGTAVKSGTHGKTNLKTEKLAARKTIKSVHSKKTNAKHAKKPAAHGKTAGKDEKPNKPVANTKAKKASAPPVHKVIAGKNIKQHKAVAKPAGKVVKK
jgi:hypothetical protein